MCTTASRGIPVVNIKGDGTRVMAPGKVHQSKPPKALLRPKDPKLTHVFGVEGNHFLNVFARKKEKCFTDLYIIKKISQVLSMFA